MKNQTSIDKGNYPAGNSCSEHVRGEWRMTRVVLIIGSAPDALRAREFHGSGYCAVVALNNAWRIRDDWTHSVYPEDFEPQRRPSSGRGKTLVEYDKFVPANNAYGGIIYAGGTMAFTGEYWALHVLMPDMMAFIGCDMVYDGHPAQSHFYGQGQADPLREDPTLQCLEAKADRLRWMAYNAGCLCVNLSDRPLSRLTFDRVDVARLTSSVVSIRSQGMDRLGSIVDQTAAAAALEAEAKANCFVAEGDYWNATMPLDPRELERIDGLWRSVFRTGAAG